MKVMMIAVLIMINILHIKSQITNLRSSDDYDDDIMEVTCLGKFTGIFHSFIYFSENNNNTNYYVIRTSWLMTYPQRIKNNLKKHKNIIIYDKNPTSKCGWTLVSKIMKAQIYTGYVYRSHNENKYLEYISGEILSNIFPSLEIESIVFIPVGFVLLIVLICYLVGCTISSNYSYQRY